MLDASVVGGYLLVASGSRFFVVEPHSSGMQVVAVARGFVACNQDACSESAAACRSDLAEEVDVAG